MSPVWNKSSLQLLDDIIESDVSKYKNFICEKELYSELAMLHKSKFNWKINKGDIKTQTELINELKNFKREISYELFQ